MDENVEIIVGRPRESKDQAIHNDLDLHHILYIVFEDISLEFVMRYDEFQGKIVELVLLMRKIQHVLEIHTSPSHLVSIVVRPEYS